ncbi:Protein phosphatase PTC7-like protein [Smittium mucronatum]|uniref:Protein phosphatase n=1 Tax=Smittium mucronatum TaxID=133383 RepID=A0A1R0GZM1_9FUNG|nr:Protein phosphatase PTC7-like protein [Smittium mucronatum]OLY82350.1 Protein phosphatase PTC7-like protein [Smittium mucronatum]
MPVKLTNIIPKFRAVLATANLSKKNAAAYIKAYTNLIKGKEHEYKEGGKELPPFNLPIRTTLQVFDQGRLLDSATDPSPARITQPKSTEYDAYSQIPYEKNAGEDSFFLTTNNFNLVFGVADGVGGWNDSGIDPSVFSRTLTNYITRVGRTQWTLHQTDSLEPSKIISLAYAHMINDDHPLFGSSTITVGSINLVDGKFDISQLGDSGYSIYSVGGSSATGVGNGYDTSNHESTGNVRTRIVSPDHQHKFNMPYQLVGKLPSGRFPHKSLPPKNGLCFEPVDPISNDKLPPKALEFKSTISLGLDTPLDSVSSSYNLEAKDLVLVATDGLFDNVFNEEIESIISKHLFPPSLSKDGVSTNSSSHSLESDIALIANDLVMAACLNYLRSDLESPFSQRAKQAGYSFRGGKPDDITLTLAYLLPTIPNSKL